MGTSHRILQIDGRRRKCPPRGRRPARRLREQVAPCAAGSARASVQRGIGGARSAPRICAMSPKVLKTSVDQQFPPRDGSRCSGGSARHLSAVRVRRVPPPLIFRQPPAPFTWLGSRGLPGGVRPRPVQTATVPRVTARAWAATHVRARPANGGTPKYRRGVGRPHRRDTRGRAPCPLRKSESGAAERPSRAPGGRYSSCMYLHRNETRNWKRESQITFKSKGRQP